MCYWLHMQSNRRRFILWLCYRQGPNPRLHWCKIGRRYMFLTALAEKAFLCSETIFASSAVYFNMQCQCTGCTDGRQAARKYEGASDKSIRCTFFFLASTVIRKVGKKTMTWLKSSMKWQDKKKNVQVTNPPISPSHPASRGRTNYCRPAYRRTFSCVSPAADGTKLPACWRRLMLVLELHLPSRKDNQLTEVFNLKYSHWTMEHSAQPLHRGSAWTWLQSLTGEHVSSVLPMCRHSLSSNSQKVEQYGAFQNSSWDEEVFTARSFIWLLKHPVGLFSQGPRLEVELQLSASVCRADDGLSCDGKNIFNEDGKLSKKGSERK